MLMCALGSRSYLSYFSLSLSHPWLLLARDDQEVPMAHKEFCYLYNSFERSRDRPPPPPWHKAKPTREREREKKKKERNIIDVHYNIFFSFLEKDDAMHRHADGSLCLFIQPLFFLNFFLSFAFAPIFLLM